MIFYLFAFIILIPTILFFSKEYIYRHTGGVAGIDDEIEDFLKIDVFGYKEKESFYLEFIHKDYLFSFLFLIDNKTTLSAFNFIKATQADKDRLSKENTLFRIPFFSLDYKDISYLSDLSEFISDSSESFLSTYPEYSEDYIFIDGKTYINNEKEFVRGDLSSSLGFLTILSPLVKGIKDVK